MSRILMLTPQMPFPPRQGASFRNYYIIRGLSERHQVSLLTFGDEIDSAGLPGELLSCDIVTVVSTPSRSRSQRLLRLIGDARPDMAHRLDSQAFDDALIALLKGDQGHGAEPGSFDVIQIEGLELARTIPIIRTYHPGGSIVFDNHNAESELQRLAFRSDIQVPRRWPAAVYSWIQSRRLRRFEAWACQAVDAVTVVSGADRSHLDELVPGLSPAVVPNCIDVADYETLTGERPIPSDLVFVGKMDYRPNVDAVLWFSREIWPLIHSRRPGATFTIVGQKPHSRLEPLTREEGITVTGQVERVQPYLAGAKVCILPFTIASGTRLKLIEAMASGKAIVSTQKGAEGFPVENGRQLLLADDPDEFAKVVLELLQNPEARATLSQEAREFSRQYDWRNVIPRFETVYARLSRSGENHGS